MNTLKITSLQAFLLLTITSAVTNQTTLIPLILKVAGRDSWISVIMAIVPGIILLLMLQFIMNVSMKESIISWVKRHFGSFAGWMIALPFMIYLLTDGLITLKDTTNWVDTTFLQETPRFVIAASLTLLCYMTAQAGFWSITLCAGVLLPFFVLLEIFLLLVNIQYKNYQYVMPVLENGYTPVLHGTLFSAHTVIEVVILLLIQHHIKTKVRSSFVLLLIVVQIGLVLGTLLDILTNFSPGEVALQRYPTFEQWGLVTLGKNVAHLDFLSIYEWLSGAFIRLSLCMYIIIELFQFKSRKAKKSALLVLTGLMLITPLFPISDPLFVWFLREKFYPFTLMYVFAVLCLLVMFAVIVRLRKRGGHSHAAESAHPTS
ncbi:GerAB/ArcD/ProY family transporter [Paenibacillus sacheonensis]|uniref:Endospore germination permease n=1 Tax=Paenibacillus sacheonensis TaxID=742054 RepID=A0A7X4YQD8_9BACL|nr:endospore germination permease [Paenibacillus sacheonensis]MBM7566403.1 spore germination protein (amino acid permease) [Paenibacillus sacheonensis]NBC70602.1 endospore germination permease [Paenibacillus sacheonensis]